MNGVNFMQEPVARAVLLRRHQRSSGIFYAWPVLDCSTGLGLVVKPTRAAKRV